MGCVGARIVPCSAAIFKIEREREREKERERARDRERERAREIKHWY